MSEFKFRPRFKIETQLTTEQAEEKIIARFKAPHNFVTSQVKGHYIVQFPEQIRQYWSPQMDISVYYDEYTETTQIRCLLAPAPTVWTMFIFLYSFAGFGIMFGLIIGSSQYTLDQDPLGFWMALGSFIVMAALFAIAQFGKRITIEEMRDLRDFIYEIDW